MPKNPEIKKVLVLGSGPIVIGQAAEFDYAGTQACRALKEEGVEVVLVNSNPATIMTDKDIAAGRAFITSQNHGYVVTKESVRPEVAEISHVNVNEGSVEGLKYKRPNCFTVQFHPEASPGPMDTEYLFDRFVENMKGGAR